MPPVGIADCRLMIDDCNRSTGFQARLGDGRLACRAEATGWKPVCWDSQDGYLPVSDPPDCKTRLAQNAERVSTFGI